MSAFWQGAAGNSSLVLLYSVVPTYYSSQRRANPCLSPHRTLSVGMPSGEGKRKGVVPAHEGLAPQERSPCLSPVQRFNINRTSRTRTLKTLDRCVAFWAFDATGNIKGVPCGLWSCTVCQKQNARLWAWRAEMQYDSDDLPYYFWTLTLGSNYTNVRRAYNDLKKLWDRLRQRVKREYQKKYNVEVMWPYLAFVEGQPKRNGMPHFHIISALPAPYRIKDFAVDCGFGHQAEEKVLMTGKRAARYVAKYASKGAEYIPRDFRRVRASQDWIKLPEYAGEILLVKQRNELLTEYLIRVSDATGVSLDSLYQNWRIAHEMD